MKQQRNFIFIVFCLLLAAGLMHTFELFKNHFSPLKQTEAELTQARESFEREKLRSVVLKSQLLDFKYQVASILPHQEKTFQETLPARGLASVVETKLEVKNQFSNVLMAEGKAAFEKADYKKSAQTFTNLVEKYPSSPLSVQAHFFLAESYYLDKEYQQSLDVIDRMVTQYPDNELTQYILLRMGQILQARNRSDEAVEVYRMVSRSPASTPELSRQAETLKKAAETR